MNLPLIQLLVFELEDLKLRDLMNNCYYKL